MNVSKSTTPTGEILADTGRVPELLNRHSER